MKVVLSVLYFRLFVNILFRKQKKVLPIKANIIVRFIKFSIHLMIKLQILELELQLGSSKGRCKLIQEVVMF